jgi:hypothetical protein
MSEYFLLFGTTPELSRQEWQAVYPAVALQDYSARLAKIDWPDLQPAETLVDRLGGLVKVLRVEQTLTVKTQPELYELVTDYLATHQSKPEFSLSEYGSSKVGNLSPQELKNLLKLKGLSARFLRQDGDGLSAAVLLHQKNVIELVLIHQGTDVVLAKTVGVQNIDDWTVRDRNKPYADSKKGMLPPKVARMMVNIGLGTKENAVLLDPFCGSGTVLMEAALLGAQIAGSDADPVAITGTKANLEWLAEVYPQTAQATEAALLQIADATHLQVGELNRKIDVIVTEPFLGKPKPQPGVLANMFKGLEKLYLGALKQWQTFLKPGATIVMIWPVVEAKSHQYSLLSLIDKLRPWGYTLQVDPPVRYFRPLAIVQRQIVVLTWQPPQQGNPNKQ